MKTSSLEEKVILILKSEKIDYEREKVFSDLRNGLYKFDFYIKDRNTLIEVQGQQHYSFTKRFHKKREDFLKAQERDRNKIQYCLAHKYDLYCIPYWEIDNLKNFNDILNEDFKAKNKFHNDTVWRNFKNRKI